MRRILLLVTAALSLLACAPGSRPVLLEAAPDAARDRKWEKYGAYCLVDELFVEASYHSGLGESPLNTYVINKKIRILTPEGARFGTVEVPVYSTSPRVFRLEHFDSAGAPVALDPAPIRAEWLKTGKIVFPKVAPGSLLSIRIESGSLQPVTTFEHWFSGPIPVAEGRFTFSHLDVYGYEFKTYGPVGRGRTERAKGAGRLQYQAWVVRDALPRSDLDFQDDIDVSEPRVAAVIRRFQSREIFESWETLSSDYRKYALRTAFFKSSRRLRALVDSLAAGKPDAEAKAAAVFAWVQANISHKPGALGAINPDQVIAAGKGNLWEMAVVLREMFERLGLATDLLVTRPRSLGGFDPAFVNPAQLGVPLVMVRVGKEERLAFPWSDGAALGEYPLDYVGLQSLSLEARAPASLPGFAAGLSYARNDFRVRPGDAEAAATLEMELGGYLAYALRTSLFGEGPKEVRESYQRILTRLGTSNAVDSLRVTGLQTPGRPVSARLAFRNPNQVVGRKGESQMRLSHVYHAFFASYDTTRSSGFKTALDMEHADVVRVPKEPGRALAADIRCRPLTNALFRQDCATEETPEEHVFRRTVRVNRKRLTADEMRALAPDIAALNAIRESILVWKPSATTPAGRSQAGSPKAARGEDP